MTRSSFPAPRAVPIDLISNFRQGVDQVLLQGYGSKTVADIDHRPDAPHFRVIDAHVAGRNEDHLLRCLKYQNDRHQVRVIRLVTPERSRLLSDRYRIG